jgi:fructoselysine-6-P-deglycase FrlB-like protein
MSGKDFKPSAALVAAQTATLARLVKISDQFNQTRGSGRLANKVAILTGCGSLKGIGRATAVLFAREGKDLPPSLNEQGHILIKSVF